MDDRIEITQLYYTLYTAMLKKDEAALDRVNDDSFELTHISGMRQSKKEYIRAVMNGTLNYYAATPDGLVLYLDGTEAELTGRSRVSASVFGGEKRTWKLELDLNLKKTDHGWKFTQARASTYA